MKAEYFTFVAKEYSGPQAFIATEPLDKDPSFIDLKLDLPDGTDINKAQKIANYLNKNIKEIHVR